jgi:hypothetical protein
MKNFKKLSREELRNTFGGQACTLTIQGSDGKWITRVGVCKRVSKEIHAGDSAISIALGMLSGSYCETGLGNVSVTSNGGNSRC